jgi:hypothetical protein
MSTNYLFAQVNLPPRKNTKPHYLFIVDHPVCSFEIDDEMKKNVYRFSPERIYKLRENDNYSSETASPIFDEEMHKLIDDGRTTVLVKYDPDFIKGYKHAADDYDRLFASRWVFVTFFHGDDDTRKLPVNGPDYDGPIDQKAEWLLDIAELPFLKKVEIPLDMVLTWDYIKDLFQEHVVW